jgi:Protein of unknown function (DUF5672)
MAQNPLIHYLKQFETATAQHRCGSSRVAVIVEPRPHKLLKACINNVMFHLGPEWNIHIFTSQHVVDSGMLNCYSDAKITVIPFDNLTHTLYNQMFTSRSFWETIKEEHILVFQTDCVMFRALDDNWLKYAYVGGNYYAVNDVAPHLGGIQGGFSLRHRSAMIECIEKVPTHYVNEYRQYFGLPLTKKGGDIHEDVFFTHACEILGLCVPTPEQRRKFAIEADYHPYTCAHHGLGHAYMTIEQMEELVKNAVQPATTFRCEDPQP